jgi:hypothetical protein
MMVFSACHSRATGDHDELVSYMILTEPQAHLRDEEADSLEVLKELFRSIRHYGTL